MPRKDGTGSVGAGGCASITRQVERGVGRGRMRGSAIAGLKAYCECSNCGEIAKHLRGVPCTSLKCPKCGMTMNRK
ncbi:hypothetical protein GC105_07510 [Alkalibaculum sp. M08DMB]|uniref:Uncharacterized protein n=1 Tax=Alkalibaculum sporogenes TaxID=2655001 RepID=A0A6A7K886_9FIRM|nr:hypothetical protein [Alkalibaculum sporogenes]MPW25634.1 hypothetical protein [Alkalibaculum sporogenes]